jgi:hypothetical protein
MATPQVAPPDAKNAREEMYKKLQAAPHNFDEPDAKDAMWFSKRHPKATTEQCASFFAIKEEYFLTEHEAEDVIVAHMEDSKISLVAKALAVVKKSEERTIKDLTFFARHGQCPICEDVVQSRVSRKAPLTFASPEYQHERHIYKCKRLHGHAAAPLCFRCYEITPHRCMTCGVPLRLNGILNLVLKNTTLHPVNRRFLDACEDCAKRKRASGETIHCNEDDFEFDSDLE